MCWVAAAWSSAGANFPPDFMSHVWYPNLSQIQILNVCLFILSFYVYRCFVCVYACALNVYQTHGDQKRTPDPNWTSQKLRAHVGAGNKMWSSEEQPVPLNIKPSLQAPQTIF